MQKPMPSLLKAREVAALLNVPDQTVYQWVSQRKIPHYKIGKSVRFDPAEIAEWLRGRKVEASPSAKAALGIRQVQDRRKRQQFVAKKIVANCS
jgi:excisionase family DNA binding protein